MVKLILNFFMSRLFYHQVFFISIYPSGGIEYWWTSYFIWKIVCERTYFFPIYINYHYYVLQKKFINTIVYLRTIFNGNINIICYGSKGIASLYLRSISQNYYNTLSPLHIPIKEHDIIMDENNWIEGIEFEKYFSIGTQDTTYD